MKNIYRGDLLLVKLQPEACNFNKITHLLRVFHVFKIVHMARNRAKHRIGYLYSHYSISPQLSPSCTSTDGSKCNFQYCFYSEQQEM